MAANTSPIYTLTPNVGWGIADGNAGTPGPLKTANTAKDGTGTVLTCFTAGANGSYVQLVRFRAAGSNVGTVVRVFVNNGLTNATIANNILFDELSLAGTTLSEVSALSLYELPLGFAIQAGYKINMALGTTVAAGYCICVVGGDY